MSNRTDIKGIRARYLLVTLIFVALAIALNGLMLYYWFNVLEPRLRAEAEVQSSFLAHSQTSGLVETLSSDDGTLAPYTITPIMDRILLFSDPETGEVFFKSLSLSVDYDVIYTEEGMLDLKRGEECADCFTSEVPLYSKHTDELMGIATFKVSARFFKLLSREVRNKLLAESVAAMVLLLIVWLVVLGLVRKLQRQIEERLKAEIALKESEKRFKQLTDASFEGVIIHEEGKVIDCNKAAAEIFETSSEALTGRSVTAFFSEESRNTVIEKLLSGTESLFEAVSAKEDGSLISLELRGRDIEYKGYATKVLAFRDITERKCNEEKLQNYKILFDNITDLAYILDDKGDILYLNGPFEKLSGHKIEDFIGKSFAPLFEGETQEKAMDAYMRTMAGEALTFVLDFKESGVICEYTSMPLKDPDGNIIGAIGTARDISERQHAERRIKEYAVKLENSNRELSEFAFTASHDLREPLRKINAYSELLIDECGDEFSDDGKGYVSSIQRAIVRMQDLMTALLSYSRISTSADPFIRIELSDVTKEAVDDLQVLLKDTAGTVEIDEDMPTVEGDQVQLRQLIFNLIGNALKYRKKDVPPIVKVTAAIATGERPGTEGQFCIIKVTDNGIGFEEKYNEKIFAVFQRLHGREEYEGTGIGLALCNKIVTRHGGRITAESSLGEGSVFKVLLPMQQKKES